jgi:hypothetical protein
MGVSETILAAMIGAAATISTAIVQLLRSRSLNDSRPRRSRIRSCLSIAALMLASGAAGFAYSELRSLDIPGEVAALRRDLRGQAPAIVASPIPNAASLRSVDGGVASVEAIAQLPPCVSTATDAAAATACSDAAIQRVALCATLPEGARSGATHLYARGVDAAEPWLKLTPETTAPAASDNAPKVRAQGESFRYVVAPGSEAICIVVGNWTAAHTEIARWVVDVQYGDAT